MDDMTYDQVEREIFPKIRIALKCKRPRGSVIQHREISAALDAIGRETGTNREEIIWRAIRLYLTSYVHTHKAGWLEPAELGEDNPRRSREVSSQRPPKSN